MDDQKLARQLLRYCQVRTHPNLTYVQPEDLRCAREIAGDSDVAGEDIYPLSWAESKVSLRNFLNRWRADHGLTTPALHTPRARRPLTATLRRLGRAPHARRVVHFSASPITAGRGSSPGQAPATFVLNVPSLARQKPETDNEHTGQAGADDIEAPRHEDDEEGATGYPYSVGQQHHNKHPRALLDIAHHFPSSHTPTSTPFPESLPCEQDIDAHCPSFPHSLRSTDTVTMPAPGSNGRMSTAPRTQPTVEVDDQDAGRGSMDGRADASTRTAGPPYGRQDARSGDPGPNETSSRSFPPQQQPMPPLNLQPGVPASMEQIRQMITAALQTQRADSLSDMVSVFANLSTMASQNGRRSDANTGGQDRQDKLRLADVGTFNPGYDDPDGYGVVSDGKTNVYTDVYVFVEHIRHLARTYSEQQVLLLWSQCLGGKARLWFSHTLTDSQRRTLEAMSLKEIADVLVENFKPASAEARAFLKNATFTLRDLANGQDIQAFLQLVARNSKACGRDAANQVGDAFDALDVQIQCELNVPTAFTTMDGLVRNIRDRQSILEGHARRLFGRQPADHLRGAAREGRGRGRGGRTASTWLPREEYLRLRQQQQQAADGNSSWQRNQQAVAEATKPVPAATHWRTGRANPHPQARSQGMTPAARAYHAATVGTDEDWYEAQDDDHDQVESPATLEEANEDEEVAFFAGEPAQHRCMFCEQLFPSRNKLHTHLVQQHSVKRGFPEPMMLDDAPPPKNFHSPMNLQ